MELNISLSKKKVFDRTATIAGYTAKSEAMLPDADTNVYKRIAVFEPYAELLDDKFEEACRVVTEVVADIAPYYTDETDDGFDITCDMPYNWDYAFEGQTSMVAMDFAVAYMTAFWMRIVKRDDDEKKYLDDADGKLLMLRKYIHAKRRVSRREFVKYMLDRREYNKQEGEQEDEV